FQLRSRTVQEGCHFKLSCIVQAHPPAKIRWLFNGIEVTRIDPDMKLEFSYGMASLEVDRIMAEHSGKYTCMAYSEAGEASTECMVKVQAGKEKAVPRAPKASRITKKTKTVEEFDEEFEEFKRQEDEDIAARKIQRGLKTMRSRSRTSEDGEQHEEHHHEEHHEVHEDGFHEVRHVESHEEVHESKSVEIDTSSGHQLEITDVTEEAHEENEIEDDAEGDEAPHKGYKGPVVVVKP
ncbi:immunoglobulin domain-containing protein, partial [Salmonella sp. s51884]|uniref:immunoglobulin domain-containing protein n=1 Tax=Salmonella sp. s51884 TaxID=3159654 RepID=UPI0039804CF2